MNYGVLFNRKSGKVVKVLTDKHGTAFLKMFAMNNVSATRDYVVFGSDGIIVGYFEGKKNDIPNICYDMEGMHIDEIAQGLLEELEG